MMVKEDGGKKWWFYHFCPDGTWSGGKFCLNCGITPTIMEDTNEM